jgi:excisionase family DNA binding protein
MKQPTTTDPLLTIAQAARLFSRSESTVRNWVLAGMIRWVRMPSGRVGIRRSVVDAFVTPETSKTLSRP